MVILDALREAERNPVHTKIDLRKLARKPRLFKVDFGKGKASVPRVVSVPEQDDDEPAVAEPKPLSEPATRHTEIQYHRVSAGGTGFPSRSRCPNRPHATRKSSTTC